MTTIITTVRVGDYDVRAHLPSDVDGWLAAVAALDTFGVHKRPASERLPVLAALASEVVHPDDQAAFTHVATVGEEVNAAYAADALTAFLDDYVRNVTARTFQWRPRPLAGGGRRHWASWLPYSWRGVHKRVAARLGFFWLPCPVCRQSFGGHERRRVKGRPDALPVSGSPGEWTMICPCCTRNGYGTDWHPDGPRLMGDGGQQA
ncbi:hypothetical protein [Streptosporangium sp. CA-115845]|uniref:hypothetical protein n=1 Tax=Streptosporangium sp. CA-115845 TaxID=3240071 RepID=UPI003D931CD6